MPIGYKHKTDKRYKKVSLQDRFWKKVAKAAQDECWEWLASKRKGFGYGQFSVNGYPEFSHRVSWELSFGPIPPGVQVCHDCDNPGCVNPNHLFLCTQKENSEDMVNKGRDAFVGERNPAAKLTNALVLQARQLHESGVIAAEISRQLGIHRATLADALKRKSWRHI